MAALAKVEAARTVAAKAPDPDALVTMLRQGFDATTLDAIAAAADISRRTFFHYFPSKEAILDAFGADWIPYSLATQEFLIATKARLAAGTPW